MNNPTPKKKALVFEAEIPGRVRIKKNNRRLSVRRGKPMSFASRLYSQWEIMAVQHLLRARLRRDSTLTGPVHAEYTFHFKNRSGEADVSNCIEGPQDCLALAKIIKNDKLIMSLDAQKIFDGTEKTIIRLFKFVNE